MNKKIGLSGLIAGYQAPGYSVPRMRTIVPLFLYQDENHLLDTQFPPLISGIPIKFARYIFILTTILLCIVIRGVCIAPVDSFG